MDRPARAVRAVRLAPMSAAGFEAFAARAVAEYAADKVLAGQWRADAAPELSRRTFATMLPGGPETPGHRLFVLHDASTGARVGTAWLHFDSDDGVPFAYLYDIRIDDAVQGRGYGRAALAALEDEARAAGCRSMQLHAFGHNGRAQRLYESAGYRTTNVNMCKDLG